MMTAADFRNDALTIALKASKNSAQHRRSRRFLRKTQRSCKRKGNCAQGKSPTSSDLRQLKNLEGLFTFDLEQDNLAAVNAPYSQKLDAQAFAYCLMSLAPANDTGTDVLCFSAKSR
jgi:hypothetical protein